jgi:hypothetical protein
VYPCVYGYRLRSTNVVHFVALDVTVESLQPLRSMRVAAAFGDRALGGSDPRPYATFESKSMFVERVTLINFRCFGSEAQTLHLPSGLTAFVGANGSGKTAVMNALLRLFGVSAEQRRLRRQDFHVPLSSTSSSGKASTTSMKALRTGSPCKGCAENNRVKGVIGAFP